MILRKIGFLAVFLAAIGAYFLAQPKVILEEKPATPTVNKLELVVKKALEGATSTYGIYIKNFKTSESYFKNENFSFTSASIYKLWVAKEAYRQIANGDLRLENVITEDIAGLNRYYGISDEEAEITSGVYSMTVKDAINQMITISHNNSALALAKKLGIKNVMPTTTPKQVGQFFEDLYYGKMVNASASALLLETLKKQENKEVIPKYLPPDTVVAHKTGNLLEFYHDGGIVFAPKGDYIIVLMSQGDNPVGAIDRMANVSKAVYEYFTK